MNCHNLDRINHYTILCQTKKVPNSSQNSHLENFAYNFASLISRVWSLSDNIIDFILEVDKDIIDKHNDKATNEY